MTPFVPEPMDDQRAVSQEQLASEKPSEMTLAEFQSEQRLEQSAEKKDAPRAYEKMLEKVRSVLPTHAVVSDDVATSDTDAIALVEAKARVDRLVALAVEKGPQHAFKVAMKLDDLYTLDKLHDTLVEKLYDVLVEKGFVKNTR